MFALTWAHSYLKKYFQLYNVIDQTNEDETRGKPVIYVYIYIYERRIWGMLTDLSVLTNIF